MKESAIYHALARVTGEPVRRLRRMGFTLIRVPTRPPKARRAARRPCAADSNGRPA
jgi:hypothetical protein